MSRNIMESIIPERFLLPLPDQHPEWCNKSSIM